MNLSVAGAMGTTASVASRSSTIWSSTPSSTSITAALCISSTPSIAGRLGRPSRAAGPSCSRPAVRSTSTTLFDTSTYANGYNPSSFPLTIGSGITIVGPGSARLARSTGPSTTRARSRRPPAAHWTSTSTNTIRCMCPLSPWLAGPMTRPASSSSRAGPSNLAAPGPTKVPSLPPTGRTFIWVTTGTTGDTLRLRHLSLWLRLLWDQ